MKTVKTEKDIESLELGEGFIIVVDGLDKFADDPDGPVAMLDSKEWAEAERLGKLVEERFAKPPSVAVPTLTVGFDATHALITSAVDRSAVISGDVRDGTIKLSAGKVAKRKLTNENHGYVTVDGEKFVR